MNKNEKSLLLYFESCLVEKRGRVNLEHMNDGDTDIMKKWTAEGFISTGRIRVDEYMQTSGSMWVEFSDEAWILAHEERKDRSKRMIEKRGWLKTSEKNRGTQ